MPNKWKPNCATCVLAKGDLSLRKRIRYAAYNREQGDETLGDIALAIHVSTGSIYNHVKKHMEDVSERYTARKEIQTAKKVAEIQAVIQKEAETVLSAAQVDSIESRPGEIISLDDYLAQGAAMIKKGEMKITAQTYLAAVKIKNEWSAKQQNNKLEFLRTISAFRGGSKVKDTKPVIEGEELDGTTNQVAESIDGGKNEARGIYRGALGHAAAQGTD